jgi:hypothetical protein
LGQAQSFWSTLSKRDQDHDVQRRGREEPLVIRKSNYGWNHTFSEIFNSLISAGLTINFLHEHPFCAWEPFPDMEKGEDRFMRFKDQAKRDLIPLMYSLKATKMAI